jgi:hypothetical protein
VGSLFRRGNIGGKDLANSSGRKLFRVIHRTGGFWLSPRGAREDLAPNAAAMLSELTKVAHGEAVAA